LVKISKSREMRASVDSVWEILSDTDNDQKYWTNIRDIKVLSRDGNTIEREAKVGPQAFSHESRQTMILDPKKSIKLMMTGDTMQGGRMITLVPVAKNGARVDVEWDFELKNVPGFVQDIVKNQLSKSTEKALSKIAEEAERSASSGSTGKPIT
jgi:carbon monoxide dehydrogenase subunit G